MLKYFGMPFAREKKKKTNDFMIEDSHREVTAAPK